MSVGADITFLSLMATITWSTRTLVVVRTCSSTGLALKLPVRVRLVLILTVGVMTVTDLRCSSTCMASRPSAWLSWCWIVTSVT